MKSKAIQLISACVLLSLWGCHKNTTSHSSLKVNAMIEKAVEIIETKKVEGYPQGCDFDRNEIYIQSELKASRKFLIKIVAADTGEIKKTVELAAGDFRSPTEFYNPSHIQCVDGRFYLMDQYEKFAVYDGSFNYLYSSMFNTFRSFVDIFSRKGETLFIIGIPKQNFKSTISRIELYRLPVNKKPVQLETLYETEDYPSILSTYREEKTFNKGYFWPSIRGFEKNGILYFSNGLEKGFHIYNLETKEKKMLELSYLSPHKYPDQDAGRLGYWKSGGWEATLKTRHNTRVLYVAFPGETYHFGIYDVGMDKIGIVSGIDLEKMTFRLDILEVSTVEPHYLESIVLPFGTGFKSNMAHNGNDFIKTCIDVDKCLYVWSDSDDQGESTFTCITRFKTK